MPSLTSVRSYERIQPKLPLWKGKVFDYITAHPRCSRKEIARALGMETASVAGRVNELMADELIEENGVKVCGVTGNTVAALRISPTQAELFSI